LWLQLQQFSELRLHFKSGRALRKSHFATGVMYLSLDKPESKQVHQFFAMPEAFAAARKDQTMPSGTVFTVVRYAAQLDAQGNPIRGADGQFVKGELLGYAVMEKRTGWGSATRTRFAMASGNIAHSQRKRSQMRPLN
jgi:hypothetical protein